MVGRIEFSLVNFIQLSLNANQSANPADTTTAPHRGFKSAQDFLNGLLSLCVCVCVGTGL